MNQPDTGIQANMLIPDIRHTVGQISGQGVIDIGRWVWKIEIFRKGASGQDVITNTIQSELLENPRHFANEVQAERDCESFIDAKVRPAIQHGFDKVLRKKWGLA